MTLLLSVLLFVNKWLPCTNFHNKIDNKDSNHIRKFGVDIGDYGHNHFRVKVQKQVFHDITPDKSILEILENKGRLYDLNC